MLEEPVSESPSFLRPNTPLVCVELILCVHVSIRGHLGCFHFGAVVNSAAANTGGSRCPVFVFVSLLSVVLDTNLEVG